jgi:hypothetical protein
MILLSELKKAGFIDKSHDQNGLAYRMDMPDGIMELIWHTRESFIRYQTRRSGITIKLMGVDSMISLNHFVFLTTGEFLKS